MEYEDVLVEAGLGKWEMQVYLALLRTGSTTTGPLVKKSEVPHSKIYSVLESLKGKGLANYVIKGKIKYFQAADPKVLISILREKERRLEENIPSLQKLSTLAKNRQNVEIYEGMKAIENFFIDLLDSAKKGDVWYDFSVVEDHKLERVQLFWKRIGLRRKKKELIVKSMVDIEQKTLYENVYRDEIKSVKKIVRFSEKPFPATTVILGDKIIILNFLAEPEIAVVITSTDLANSYKEFHKKHWETAQKWVK